MPSYKKFTDDEISLLNELLRKTNNYPSRRKINEMANFLKTSPLKIENWLKYNRRKLYFNGNFDQYKIRKKFSEEEISYLRRKFKENKNPDFQECQAISKELNNISGYQIKNWFANQRRKRRNAMKKQKALRIQSIKINKYVQKTNNFEKKSKEFSELDAKKAIENDTHDKKCDNYEKPNEFSPQVKKEKINQTIKIEENMIKKEIIPDMHLINFRNYSTNINTSNFQPCVPFLQTNTTKNLVNDSTNYGSLPLSFNQKQPWVQTSIGNPAFTQINGNNFILNNRKYYFKEKFHYFSFIFTKIKYFSANDGPCLPNPEKLQFSTEFSDEFGEFHSYFALSYW